MRSTALTKPYERIIGLAIFGSVERTKLPMKLEGVPRRTIVDILAIGDDRLQAERLADLLAKEGVKDTNELSTARWSELLELAKHPALPS